MRLSFLDGPPIHDDHGFLVRNEHVFQMPAWASLRSGRPLVTLLNRWTYQRFAFRPRPWHIENVIFHAIAVFLLFFLMRRCSIPHPVWVAAAFGAHPIQAHSWAYVTGRTGILAAIFLFMASLVYLSPWPVAATIPAVLAVACREDSVIFLLWLPLLEHFR